MNDRPPIEYEPIDDLPEFYEILLSPYPNGLREVVICAPSILDKTLASIDEIKLDVVYIGLVVKVS